MPDEIDTLNKYAVAVGGGGIAILAPPRAPLTEADALLLAAWLVALAGGRRKFLPVLDAVEAT